MFECENDMVVVDCGMAFPDDDMMGVDLVIPDFTFIEKNVDKIRGIVITHGHEDHIGGVPFLIKQAKSKTSNIQYSFNIGFDRWKIKRTRFTRKGTAQYGKTGSNRASWLLRRRIYSCKSFHFRCCRAGNSLTCRYSAAYR